MKLLRYGPIGKEKPGLLDAQGRIRDLSAHIQDLDGVALSPAGLARLARLPLAALPTVRGKPRIACPVARVGKLVAIGLNYADHAAEAGMPIPKEPIIFLKATSCIQGPNEPIVLPKGSRKTDWEVELGVVIGSTARSVPVREALNHVAGYCVVNDVSEREYQLERGGTWDKGKGCDTFGPIGPWLVTRDEVPQVQMLDLWLDLNGKRMQTGNTRTMIFTVAQIVCFVSRYMTLLPGDIITTGTPPGVGMGHQRNGVSAPRYLKAGDRLHLGIAGLGEQQQDVLRWQRT